MSEDETWASTHRGRGVSVSVSFLWRVVQWRPESVGEWWNPPVAWSLGTIPGKWSHSSDAYTESSEQWAQLRPESESRVWCVARIHPCYTDTGITLLCPRHLLHGHHCRAEHTAAHGSQNFSRHHFIRDIVIIMLGEWENISKQKQFFFIIFMSFWIHE